jgi:VacB/RNase II family 3'-5' exoribonuclease
MQQHHMPVDLTELAKRSMLEHRLVPDFPLEVLKETDQIESAAKPDSPQVKDMRHLLWFSLDNDNSRDLDQLTYAEAIDGQNFKIYIAVADVDSLVKKGSAIDRYAEQNTTSVYTPTKIFTMLPEKLSTDLTSLNENQERLAIVAEVDVQADGTIMHTSVYRAFVRNHAKLAYNSVSDWLDGKGPAPEAIKNSKVLDDQVRLQDKIAQMLRNYRHQHGALTLQTIEPTPIIQNQDVVDVISEIKNRGRDLIEDFMIAGNRASVNFLIEHQSPSLRRVVRIPKRWDRIVAIAQKFGVILSAKPDAKALDAFLKQQQMLDPLRFPDLSLTIIKLLGNGEYVVEYPGEEPIGHFSLAVKDYTHSTAPNRRYPDLITQRLIKAVLINGPSPYTNGELENLAKHCSEKEDEAEKVERKMKKSTTCVLLSSKINQEFDALVTGVTTQGTWVRVLHPPVDGKLVKGFEHVDVGDQIRVKLIHVDIEKGFIDFFRIQ